MRAPLPDTERPETAAFWAGCRAGELRFPRCPRCQRFRWYPAPMCPACRARGMEWVSIRGQGTIFTYTVVRRAFHPGTESWLPFISILVEFPDAPGIRLVSRLIGCPPEQARIGLPVELVFVESEGGTLPLFRPRGEPSP